MALKRDVCTVSVNPQLFPLRHGFQIRCPLSKNSGLPQITIIDRESHQLLLYQNRGVNTRSPQYYSSLSRPKPLAYFRSTPTIPRRSLGANPPSRAIPFHSASEIPLMVTRTRSTSLISTFSRSSTLTRVSAAPRVSRTSSDRYTSCNITQYMGSLSPDAWSCSIHCREPIWVSCGAVKLNV